MSRGRRYNGDRKLNMKKVFAVIIAIIILILFVMVIAKLLSGDSNTNEKSFVSAYYTIYENEKWGVMDTKGNIIIQPTYTEMIVIPDKSKDVFICLENVNYENNTYNAKALNKDGSAIYTDYSKVEVIYNYDENNNLWYETNILKVEKDGKYGMINLDGKEILACEYDDIQTLQGVEGVVVTVKDGKQGIANNIGTIIIENTYSDIQGLTTEYENGFIVRDSESGKYGVVKYNKTVALETKYDAIRNVYGNSMYVVVENGTQKVINEDQETILENGFTEVKFINSDNIIYKKDDKYGVTNSRGAEKLANEYEDLSYAFTDTFVAKKDGKYGMINSLGETKVSFEYEYIEYYETSDIILAQVDSLNTELMNRNFETKVAGIVSEINTTKNYIKVRDENNEYKYYNFKLEQKETTEVLVGNTIYLSKKDGKYGYVNNKGVVVVDYIYDDATEQNDYGYVSVKKDGKWGSLDQKGNVIVEPIYELKNNLVIDFIGQWYLAEDLNANYYTK